MRSLINERAIGRKNRPPLLLIARLPGILFLKFAAWPE
jgi:hypothetical protein